MQKKTHKQNQFFVFDFYSSSLHNSVSNRSSFTLILYQPKKQKQITAHFFHSLSSFFTHHFALFRFLWNFHFGCEYSEVKFDEKKAFRRKLCAIGAEENVVSFILRIHLKCNKFADQLWILFGVVRWRRTWKRRLFPKKKKSKNNKILFYAHFYFQDDDEFNF